MRRGISSTRERKRSKHRATTNFPIIHNYQKGERRKLGKLEWEDADRETKLDRSKPFRLGKNSIFPLPLPFSVHFCSFLIVNVNAPINEGKGGGALLALRRNPQLARISAARRRVGNLAQFISRLCSIIVGMTIIWSRLERGRARANLPNQPVELTE